MTTPEFQRKQSVVAKVLSTEKTARQKSISAIGRVFTRRKSGKDKEKVRKEGRRKSTSPQKGFHHEESVEDDFEKPRGGAATTPQRDIAPTPSKSASKGDGGFGVPNFSFDFSATSENGAQSSQAPSDPFSSDWNFDSPSLNFGTPEPRRKSKEGASPSPPRRQSSAIEVSPSTRKVKQSSIEIQTDEKELQPSSPGPSRNDEPILNYYRSPEDVAMRERYFKELNRLKREMQIETNRRKNLEEELSVLADDEHRRMASVMDQLNSLLESSQRVKSTLEPVLLTGAEPKPSTFDPAYLDLTIVEGQNITTGSQAYPYCLVRVGNQTMEKTKVVKREPSPLINQHFRLNVTSVAMEVLDIEVWNSDINDDENKIGTISLGLTDFGDGEVHDVWFQLGKSSKPPGRSIHNAYSNHVASAPMKEPLQDQETPQLRVTLQLHDPEAEWYRRERRRRERAVDPRTLLSEKELLELDKTQRDLDNAIALLKSQLNTKIVRKGYELSERTRDRIERKSVSPSQAVRWDSAYEASLVANNRYPTIFSDVLREVATSPRVYTVATGNSYTREEARWRGTHDLSDIKRNHREGLIDTLERHESPAKPIRSAKRGVHYRSVGEQRARSASPKRRPLNDDFYKPSVVNHPQRWDKSPSLKSTRARTPSPRKMPKKTYSPRRTKSPRQYLHFQAFDNSPRIIRGHTDPVHNTNLKNPIKNSIYDPDYDKHVKEYEEELKKRREENMEAVKRSRERAPRWKGPKGDFYERYLKGELVNEEGMSNDIDERVGRSASQLSIGVIDQVVYQNSLRSLHGEGSTQDLEKGWNSTFAISKKKEDKPKPKPKPKRGDPGKIESREILHTTPWNASPKPKTPYQPRPVQVKNKSYNPKYDATRKGGSDDQDDGEYVHPALIFN